MSDVKCCVATWVAEELAKSVSECLETAGDTSWTDSGFEDVMDQLEKQPPSDEPDLEAIKACRTDNPSAFDQLNEAHDVLHQAFTHVHTVTLLAITRFFCMRMAFSAVSFQSSGMPSWRR